MSTPPNQQYEFFGNIEEDSPEYYINEILKYSEEVGIKNANGFKKYLRSLQPHQLKQKYLDLKQDHERHSE